MADHNDNIGSAGSNRSNQDLNQSEVDRNRGGMGGSSRSSNDSGYAGAGKDIGSSPDRSKSDVTGDGESSTGGLSGSSSDRGSSDRGIGRDKSGISEPGSDRGGMSGSGSQSDGSRGRGISQDLSDSDDINRSNR